MRKRSPPRHTTVNSGLILYRSNNIFAACSSPECSPAIISKSVELRSGAGKQLGSGKTKTGESAANYFLINEVIEKPKLNDAPSNYAIIGRYILPIKILSILKKQKRGKGGEIHITDAIKTLVKKKEKFYGNIFKGKYIDCGTLEGFINSGLTISKYL